MTNSWSFLFDELNMSNQNYWEEDGFSIVGNPGTASPDTIICSSSTLPGGMVMINDHISDSADISDLPYLNLQLTIGRSIVKM